jgi:hypothetical protein
MTSRFSVFFPESDKRINYTSVNYLMATVLCSGGWHDVLCVIWFVMVD